MTTAPQDKSPPEYATKRILFANAKGGCGKSTLATNLAAAYATVSVPTALIDHDPQASATQWLKQRPDNARAIYGIEAFKKSAAGGTGNWFMRLPRGTQRIIIDTPAGLQGPELQDQLQLADIIVVPVLPSPIDIHSATRFIGSILLSTQYRRSPTPKQLVVLANRTRKNTKVFNKLDLFLNSLRLPKIATIRDTQQYVHCSETGLGMIESTDGRFAQDRRQWRTIIDWMETYFTDNSTATPPPDRQCSNFSR